MTASFVDINPSTGTAQPALDPAEAYERYAVPALFAPAAEQLLAVAVPSPGERVLDVGTGTGIVARRASSLVGPTGTVTGLDANAGMLRVAREAAAREDLPVAWSQGAAERLPFPDASFDLVLCQFALMFFDDIPAALAEMRRILIPGGRAVLSVFQPINRHPFYVALDREIERQLGESAVASIFALGDATALDESLSQAGFHGVAVEPSSLTARMGPPEVFLAGEIELDTAAIPAMRDLSPSDRKRLVEAISTELAEPLRTVTIDGEAVLEFQTLIARATC